MALDSMAEIFEKAEAGGKPFWQVVLDTDMEERQVTAEASLEKMRATWRAMLESVESYQGERRSVSGLVGGDGARMRDYAAKEKPLSGDYLAEVIATALGVGEFASSLLTTQAKLKESNSYVSPRTATGEEITDPETPGGGSDNTGGSDAPSFN